MLLGIVTKVGIKDKIENWSGNITHLLQEWMKLTVTSLPQWPSTPQSDMKNFQPA